ncbi:MAG: hypothetical protein ACOCWA_01900 [Bacteroidota bacterium]
MSSKNNEFDFNGVIIYAGIDTHLKNWRMSIVLDDTSCKTFSMDPDARKPANYLKKNFPNGNYYSVYKARVKTSMLPSLHYRF